MPSESYQRGRPKRRAVRQGLNPVGRDGCGIVFQIPIWIRELVGYLDLALRRKTIFGVSTAHEYKMDTDKAHAARVLTSCLGPNSD
jgi:hypothetical protein